MARRQQRQQEIPETVKQKLDELNTTNRELTNQVVAYRARLGEGDPLVVRLVDALIVGADHGRPAPSSTPTDAEKVGGKPGSSAPKGGNPAARGAVKRLRLQVWRELDTFEARLNNDWRRPDPVDVDPGESEWPRQVPSVRCGTRSCGRRGKRVPAWRVVDVDRLEVRWRCAECEAPYASHPLAGGDSIS